ncbi:ABC-2 family transporter protein [compost metagenome]
MSNWLSLVHNENIKVYSRVRTWIMLVLLVLLAVLMPVLVYTTTDIASRPDRWNVFQITISVLFYLNTIFSVIIASDAVAGEFTWGTIKLLLIRPWSRSKILLSKYTSLILFSLLSTVLLVVVGFAASFLLFKAGGDVDPPVHGWSMWQYMLVDIVCRYIELFLTIALAFMVSSVFRASGLAIGLSLFIIFAKDIFNTLFNPETYEWAKYLLFPHMNLSGYMFSNTGPGGVSFGFSIAVLAVYYVVFLALSWLVFSRRDVAG